MSNQDLDITATYDPATNTLTCAPSPATLFQHRTGKVTVTLELKQGATGTLAFQATPIQWSPPPGASHAAPNGDKVVLTVPHGNSTTNDVSHSFQVNCTYKPKVGTSQNSSGSASVVLQGQQAFTITST